MSSTSVQCTWGLEYSKPMPPHVDGKERQLQGIVIGINNTDSCLTSPLRTQFEFITIICNLWGFRSLVLIFYLSTMTTSERKNKSKQGLRNIILSVAKTNEKMWFILWNKYWYYSILLDDQEKSYLMRMK